MIDVNLLRTAITALSFATFIGIVWWAYGARRKTRFDEAADLPFADEDIDARSGGPGARDAAKPRG